ncbi:heavy-metal-associated domain-containing protein [Mumia sp. Pv 4-285]|uniref:heavy-metal-associated domain-containing protein n=1 Tax=Mumia qirimensis TaxID=3234852 RepID=UPI00351D3872
MKKTYSVTGMTCGHCAGAVTEEIGAIEGVQAVEIDLVAGGTSSVHVTSDAPIDDTAVAAAVDEAGSYQVVDA